VLDKQVTGGQELTHDWGAGKRKVLGNGEGWNTWRVEGDTTPLERGGEETYGEDDLPNDESK